MLLTPIVLTLHSFGYFFYPTTIKLYHYGKIATRGRTVSAVYNSVFVCIIDALSEHISLGSK